MLPKWYNLNMERTLLPEIRYSPQDINQKRAQVRRELIDRSPNVTGGKLQRLANSDLKLLFRLYDSIFLGNYFQNRFQGEIIFSLSTRMTANAGKLIFSKNIKNVETTKEKYELKIGINFFFKYYHLNREKKVNGIKTADSLQALQLVFEHELCHLIELHCFKKSNCRQERFKTIAQNIFGHTESYHQLPTDREIAAAQYDFRIGDRVCFTYDNIKYTGIIYNINKRATVMVPQEKGIYQDNKGNRYSKWYVPLPSLNKE